MDRRAGGGEMTRRKFKLGSYYWCKNYSTDEWQPCLYLKVCTSKGYMAMFQWSTPDYGDFNYFKSSLFYAIGDEIKPMEVAK